MLNALVFGKIKTNLCYCIEFGYSEKASKFEKIFHLQFDTTENRKILSGRFFDFWDLLRISKL